MKGRSKKFTAAVVVGPVLAVAAVPAVVVASIVTNATGIAANISTKLKTNTQLDTDRDVRAAERHRVDVHRVGDQFQLSDKGGGLGPFTLAKPTFTGCTDNLGGTDTITSNITNGHWTATYVNSAGSPEPEHDHSRCAQGRPDAHLERRPRLHRDPLPERRRDDQRYL